MRRDFPRSVLRVVRWVLFGAGIALLLDAASTAAYRNVYQHYQSRKLEIEIAALKSHGVEVTTGVGADLHDGDVVGRLEIPRIGISVVVLQGSTEHILALGAGHAPGTPRPGAGGNVVIAAHRDTFFRALRGVKTGDSIQLVTALHTFEYVMQSAETADPEDTQSMESRGREELTLITCYPFYFVGSAPKRFVVHALPAE